MQSVIRDCAVSEVIQSFLTQCVFHQAVGASNTVTRTLLTCLQSLGWSVRTDGLLENFLRPFCLFATHFPELEFRASLAWQAVVAQQVGHREGFAYLEQADAPAT